MNKYLLSLIVTLSIASSIFSSNSDTLIFSGYAELYYGYDFSNPADHNRPNYFYNYVRHNELNLNLAMAKLNYISDNIRTNFGVMFGNYAQYNLSSEPTWAQFIYEVNVGVKLSKSKNLWLDAGIMPSHIGFESAIGADCWTLSRSILAENTPYYEAGLKLSYTSQNEKWYLAGMYLNGWQKIAKSDYTQKPSFGMQITYKPSSKFTLNYSNFIGSNFPDSIHNLRLFHNFYTIFTLTDRLGLTLGIDIGNEIFTKNNNLSNWGSPVAIVRYNFNEATSAAFRLEYYTDPYNVIISPEYLDFKVFGSSFNVDYRIWNKLLWRNEIKLLNSPSPIYGDNKKSNLSYLTSISYKW